MAQVRKFVIVNMLGSVVKDTPVLTGMLRGNCQTSIGAPKEGELPLRPANMAMAEIADVAGKVKGDETVYFRNNLPYAVAIEFGLSKKRPEGMVRKNLAKFSQIVKQAVQQGKL
jgi:hypothetical protein